MADPQYTPAELMTVVAARYLRDNSVCFVGVGIPSAAANLARLTHAPKIVLIYESGTIGAKPRSLPLSIGDGELAETADVVVSVPEMFQYWLQGGRVSTGFLGAAQIDRFANINTSVIGDYHHPRTRLPGAGGASEIASCCEETLIVLPHRKRAFVETLDFITSVGHYRGGTSRRDIGLKTAGPTAVITDLGVLEPHPESRELVLTRLHPGVSHDDVQRETQWHLRCAEDIAETPVPSGLELDTLRELNARSARAHAEQAPGRDPAGCPPPRGHAAG